MEVSSCIAYAAQFRRVSSDQYISRGIRPLHGCQFIFTFHVFLYVSFLKNVIPYKCIYKSNFCIFETFQYELLLAKSSNLQNIIGRYCVKTTTEEARNQQLRATNYSNYKGLHLFLEKA